jgi:hypothetical protein
MSISSKLANTLFARILRLPTINYMPPDAREFRQVGYVVIPAEGASAIVVQLEGLKVPKGYNAIINFFANVYVGGGFQEGQGFITWTLYQDYITGVVMPGFKNIPASLGTVANPAKLNGLRVKENQQPTLVVTNSNPGVLPAGQMIGGLLGGFYYPISKEPDDSTF